MNKILGMLVVVILVGCHNKSDKKADNFSNSIIKAKPIDSFKQTDESIASPPPSQEEERKRLSKIYNDVKLIDSVFVMNGDTLHFHARSYYLINEILVVPKKYDENEKNPQEFSTHPYATEITLTNKKDTVLNKQFTANDFYPYFTDNFGGALKKYGSLLEPELSRQKKDKGKIVMDYSLSIPATDLGIGISLTIDKNGHYQISPN